MLRNGGTLYLDEGKPTPDGVEAETVANLREVSPTAIYTVPKGLEVLVQHMQHDDALRENLFRELRLVFAAGAAMPQTVIDLFEPPGGADHRAARVPMTMGLGMTETAPFAVSHHRPGWVAGRDRPARPGPGAEAGAGGRQARGALPRPEHHAGLLAPARVAQRVEHWDEEGYLCSGDAATFIDDARARSAACASTAASPKTSSSSAAPGSA